MLVVVTLDFFHPAGRSGHLVEVEEPGVENLREVNVGKIGLYDFGLGLNGADNGAQTAGLFGSDLGNLVEHHDVAKLYLLDDEIFDVFLVYVVALQLLAAVKFRLHAQGVDHRHDAVELGGIVVRASGRHALHGAECLGYRLGLADAGGLDYDVVKLPGGHELAHLEHEVALEGAADAAVLERHEVVGVFGSADYATFLYEGRVDIHFADVVDYHRKAYAAAVGENPVEQRGLAAAEISGEKHHRGCLMFHRCDILYNAIYK